MHDEDEARGAEAIAAIRAALDTTPPPGLEALATLMERLQPVLERGEGALADQARQLELRILGAIMVAQAESLRGLARQLQRLAHWLPPDRPEQN